ncbi:MAG: AlpA family phage regulatory protein [Betaproteobacteria bacterium]|nr:AlpA family phage regulatory protein [Betaproteobacteria bacterium]
MQTGITIKRAKDARAQFGIGNSTFYEWQEKGLMTPGVPLGARAVGWPAHELDAIAAARIAGKSEDEIRALVLDQIAARADAATPKA